MAGRLLVGVVPRAAARLAVERRLQRPRLASVAALEDAGRLGAREQAAVRRRQAGDLGELQAVVGVAEALARELPALAKVAAAPDARAVPLAGRGRVDRARVRVVHGVVDRPALAERAADAPVATIPVALQHEAALACPDQQKSRRHRSPPGFDLATLDGAGTKNSSAAMSFLPPRRLQARMATASQPGRW